MKTIKSEIPGQEGLGPPPENKNKKMREKKRKEREKEKKERIKKKEQMSQNGGLQAVPNLRFNHFINKTSGWEYSRL